MAPFEHEGAQYNTAQTNALFSVAEQQQLDSFLHGLSTGTELAHGMPPMPLVKIESHSSAQNSNGPVTADQQVHTLPTLDTQRRVSKTPRTRRTSYHASRYSLSPPPSPTSSGSSSGEDARGKKAGRARHRKPPQELLTEAQKKANHIASEQKRRANIRIGFEQLVDIVPALSHTNRSEALILQKSYEYIRQLIETKTDLKSQVQQFQTVLGEAYDEDSSDGETGFPF